MFFEDTREIQRFQIVTFGIGLSVLMAAFHNIGQLLCAVVVMGNSSLLYYFPALGLAGLVCGCITGVVLTVIPNKVYSGKVL